MINGDRGKQININLPKKILIAILILGVLLALASVFVYISKNLRLPKTSEADFEVGWREDFSNTVRSGKNILPKNWQVRGKPGTPVSKFTVEDRGEKGSKFLLVSSDKSTGSLVTLAKDLDLKLTPVLQWKWKADKLPTNADGRDPSKDDQAIGVYVGNGNLFNNKSVSYRWDTETPVGTEGNSVYGMGTVKVKWITLRNIKDAKKGQWFTESRNFLEDFKNAWGQAPKTVYISVTTNSQYTASTASAQLGWIEFNSKVKKGDLL